MTAQDDDGATSGAATRTITVAAAPVGRQHLRGAAPAPATRRTPPPLCGTGRALQLVEATVAGRRVRLRGIALPALAGRQFTINQQPSRAVVARGIVAADGTFTTTAPIRCRAPAAAGASRP